MRKNLSNIHGLSGAEKDVLRECSPSIARFDDIKPRLNTLNTNLNQKKDKDYKKKHISLFLDTGKSILYFDGQCEKPKLEILDKFLKDVLDNLRFQKKA